MGNIPSITDTQQTQPTSPGSTNPPTTPETPETPETPMTPIAPTLLMDEDEILDISADAMKAKEDECAVCERQCEVLEYPNAITDKIDRNFVLHDSGKLSRWHVLVTTGQSASKWPHDCFSGDWFPTDVNNVAKEIKTGKVQVSVITRGPESHCNPEEALDLIFFPEFVKYCNVEREHLNDLFHYHTNVIAPRHQNSVKLDKDTEYIAQNDELTEDEVIECEKLQEGYNGAPPSRFFTTSDRIKHGVGTKFPHPIDLIVDSFVLLCGHMIRDKRCGVTAPILREQFSIVMDAKYPDKVDKVDVDLVSHVGGHKVAGNCIIFGRGYGSVFYGRVFPEHVENIVDKTIMKGEILKPITRACHGELW
jgi:hypothetical protein